MHDWCSLQPEEGTRSLAAGITDGCQLQGGVLGTELESLEEQHVFSSAEELLQSSPLIGLEREHFHIY
ncbi:hypothetical protein I79_015217 [Cricetulus griseus]|uniref:Uncharacterized protein n=1 Tax=Cricetulus griseus TaxID=10029 RepID=G3HW67_CRIGR|nr:hypothetical protein I79_015217 [Cricetulus griseus]